MIRNKVDALHIRGTGEQYQSFYIGMAFCQIDGIADAAASAAESDSCSIDAGLGNQKLIGCLKVIRPLLIQLLPDLRRPSLEARASTLTKAAVINGERIDSGFTQPKGDRFPRFPSRIAHVQQKHARAGL